MADLIKKIKIKKQDGTFTDYIPIGADAKNITTNDGDSVELKLNKKPYYYNSVADMKADTKLKNGDMVVTLGYYSANDGGKAEYKIRNKNNNEVETKGLNIFLNNNLVAELIPENKNIINVLQWGLVNDGLTDNYERYVEILSHLYYNLHTSLYFPAGQYVFSHGIELPGTFELFGDNCNSNAPEIFQTAFLFNEQTQNTNCITLKYQTYIHDIQIRISNCYNISINRDISENNTLEHVLTEEILVDGVSGIYGERNYNQIERILVTGASNYAFDLNTFNMLLDCNFRKCAIGFRTNADCTVHNIKGFTCRVFGNIEGPISNISCLRGDSMIRGLYFSHNGNIVDDVVFDWCYFSGLTFYGVKNNRCTNVTGRIGTSAYGKNMETPSDSIDRINCIVSLANQYAEGNLVDLNLPISYNCNDSGTELINYPIACFLGNNKNNIRINTNYIPQSKFAYRRFVYPLGTQEKINILINSKPYQFENYGVYPSNADIKECSFTSVTFSS